MLTRAALAFVLSLLALTVATPALANPDLVGDPPRPGAVLVEKKTETGLAAFETSLEAIDGVRIGPDAAVLMLRDGAQSRPITLDYGDVVGGGSKAAGLGYLAGAYLALGLIGRVLYLLRMAGIGPGK